jgi:hypothetical protein
MLQGPSRALTRTPLRMMTFHWEDALQKIQAQGMAIQKIPKQARLLPQLQFQKTRKTRFHYRLRSDGGLSPKYQIDLGQGWHRADRPDFNRHSDRAGAARSLPPQASDLAL